MMDNNIKTIFKNLNIEVNDIIPANNSFNAEVYIIKSNNKKYIFKICNKEKKIETVVRYMSHLFNYLDTAEVLDSGIINNKYYVIMSYIEGENKFDEEIDTLSDKQLIEMGRLLAKLHNAPLIDEEDDSWIKYLNEKLEDSQEVLDNVFGENNKVIYDYLKDYINNDIKGNYKNSILHMDFRIGNLIFNNDKISLIDMDSMKNGDYICDFFRMYNDLSKEKFNILLSGYKEIRNIDDNFYERLKFYSLFTSYIVLYWCISRNKKDDDFYNKNYNIVMNYLKDLKK